MGANGSNNKVFLDSDAFIALYDNTDPLAARAVAIGKKLEARGDVLFTGTNIASEVATLLSQRVSHQKAIEFLEYIREGTIKLIHPSEEIILEAEQIFKKQTSKNVSYSDCVSFAIMLDRRINVAFSFDSDFKKNEFTLLEDILKN